MTKPVCIIVSMLVIINLVLVISEICKSCHYKKRISQLRKDRIEAGANEEEISDDDLKDEIEPNQLHSWIFGIIICLDIWIIGALLTHWWAEQFFLDVPENDSRKALFGDSFGAVNALVSAFAFAGMIVAFVLQRTELRLQRKELRDNRAEMMQQTMQFAAQNENLEIQRFENLYYNMLNLQQKIVDGLKYDYYVKDYVTVPMGGGSATTDSHNIEREVIGRDVFWFLFEKVTIIESTSYLRNGVFGYRFYLRNEGLDKYDGTLIPSYFDHYFRHLYKIVQFVDSQDFSFDQKYKYVSFLRGTLSRYELVWLYYNELQPGFSRFKSLIEKYSLLKSLRRDLLTISKDTNSFFIDLGVSRAELENIGFIYSDFEFYLTEKENEQGKYNISAFWNKKDIQDGKDFLYKWNKFIEEKTSSVKE